MLPHSRKPQVLRLHNLQQIQRDKFCSQFLQTFYDILPNSLNRTLKNSLFLMKLLSAIPDIYYTLVTVLLCKRRLGEQYTYIAMYKEKHYLQEGILLNKKTRTLLFLLEIITRNLFIPIFSKSLSKKGVAFEGEDQKEGMSKNNKLFHSIICIFNFLKRSILKYLGNPEEIMSNVEWLILMIYMLDWNKHFTFIETLLGINYVYTYKNDQIRDISYAVQGYLLLITFIVKGIKTFFQYLKTRKINKQNISQIISKQKLDAQTVEQKQVKEKALCRICYDDLKQKSATRCGHIFCWSCIVQTVQISNECPVCRTPCKPRQIVQLRNY